MYQPKFTRLDPYSRNQLLPEIVQLQRCTPKSTRSTRLDSEYTSRRVINYFPEFVQFQSCTPKAVPSAVAGLFDAVDEGLSIVDPVLRPLAVVLVAAQGGTGVGEGVGEAPELLQVREESLYLKILDGIEGRMHNASAIMLPALRHALNSFTRRADIIIRQLSYAGSHPSRLLKICQELNNLDESSQVERLRAAGNAMAVLELQIPDPDSLRLHTGRQQRRVNSSLEQQSGLDREARRSLFIQQAVELAFSVTDRQMRSYVVEALEKGHRIHSQNLPVRNARELLLAGHAVEVGRQGRFIDQEVVTWNTCVNARL